MLFYVAVVCCMLGMSRAQTKYCCMPAQWESQNNFIEGVKSTDTNTSTLVTGNEMLAVDGHAQMIASMTSINAGGQLASYRIIQDYRNKIQYSIEFISCSRKTLPAWTPSCIPDDAKLQLTTSYGSGTNVLNVDIYKFIRGNNTIYTTVEKDDCTPLFMAKTGTEGPYQAMLEKTYSNFTVGIQHPSIFNIPDICKTAPLVGNADGTLIGGFY